MPKFFENISPNGEFYLNAENSQHCARVLRMTVGERLTVTNGGVDFECEVADTSGGNVLCRVISSAPCAAEPTVEVTLYQCLPKGDKLETVIQKSVELGVSEIKPVLSKRCVSRPDDKKAVKKTERYQKIAKSACEQSGRGKIVGVSPIISFSEAVKEFDKYDKVILFYEGGGKPISSLMGGVTSGKIAIIIGPEGGFDTAETALARENGADFATLGPRILRTETAPVCALAAIMLLSGNME